MKIAIGGETLFWTSPKPPERTLCLCERGSVRSVTLASVLKDYYGYADVLAAGLATTTKVTLGLLRAWAQLVIVVGNVDLAVLAYEKGLRDIKLLDVGTDRWLMPMHPDLVGEIVLMLERTGLPRVAIYYSNKETYLRAVNAAWERLKIT